MPYRRPDKLRQVAVLVASLDETLADALLSELPPAEADQVRQLVGELDEIDPDEQADVLEQLRRSAQPPVQAYHDTLEIESTLADQLDRWSQTADPATAPNRRFRERIAAADAKSLAVRLQAEHPQIIAVALLRLPEEKAEAVFDALPAELQQPVVQRLTHSTPADEDAVSDLEAHLAQSIAHDLQLESHRAAGSELVQRLRGRLAPADEPVGTPTAPPAASTQQASLEATDPAPVAAAPPLAAAPDEDRRQRALSSLAAWARYREASQRSNQAADEQPSPEASQQPTPDPAAASAVAAVRYDPADLERLDDHTLLAVLSAAEPRQAQLALHAGSNQLFRRVVRQAPRRAARQLRHTLHNLGPVPLRELDEAQQALLRLARERGATVRVVAAATA